MAEGWISIHRKIRDNHLFKEKRVFSKFEAWLDLLLEVNHQDNKFILGNELVEVKRGSTITSIRQLCDKWGWSNTKVKKFFELLELDEMITHKSDTKKTLVSIVNYDLYQPKEKEKRHENDTKTTRSNHENDTKTTRKHTNNNVNNDNNENNVNNEKKENKNTLVCDDEFENFWLLYDKKVSKPICIKKWNKISKEDKELIFKNLPAYIKSTPDKKYRKNPETWLNQECWNDELIEKNESKTTETSGDDKKWSMWD